MSNQAFVGRQEILGREEILGEFVGREEILGDDAGREEILGAYLDAHLDPVRAPGASYLLGREEILGGSVDADEQTIAGEEGLAERAALRRRSSSCGYNGKWTNIRAKDTDLGAELPADAKNLKVFNQLKAKANESYALELEEIRKDLWKSSYPIVMDASLVAFLQKQDPRFGKYYAVAKECGAVVVESKGRRVGKKVGPEYGLVLMSGDDPGDDPKKTWPAPETNPAALNKALDEIRPIASRKTKKVLAAYEKNGHVGKGTRKCILLLDRVEAGDASAKAEYAHRRNKALSGQSPKSMDYWADLYAAAQLRKVLRQKGVKLSGAEPEVPADVRQKAGKIAGVYLQNALKAKKITQGDLGLLVKYDQIARPGRKDAASYYAGLLKEGGVVVSGASDEDKQKARTLLDAAANANPKKISRGDLKKAILLYAGPDATDKEKAAVGSKMLTFLQKRKIEVS